MIRKSAVAGSWYPSDKKELEATIQELEKRAISKFVSQERAVVGLIAPHAGFVYSGATTVAGFQALKNNEYDLVVLLGASHKMRNGTIAVFDGEGVDTPLGVLKVDMDFSKALSSIDKHVMLDSQLHKEEHCLELMFPFIKHYMGSPEVVLVLTATEDDRLLRKFGEQLAILVNECGKRVLLLASTDMSHYHPYEEAVKMDGQTIALVEKGQYSELDEAIHEQTAELCGYDALVAFFTAMKSLNSQEGRLVKYETSGDAVPQSRSRGVVGYMSMVFER